MKCIVRFFTTMAIGMPLCVIALKDTKSVILLLLGALAFALSVTQHVYFAYKEDETSEKSAEKDNKHLKYKEQTYKRQIRDFFFYHNMYLIDNRYKNQIFYDALIEMLIF